MTGRGAVVNLGFAMLIQGLAVVQAFIVPRLLGPDNIGLFAIAMGGVGIGMTLKELGIPQKLVQERDVDLHTSYSVAFTLEILLAVSFLGVVLVGAPVLAWAYGRHELWLLTTVLGMSIFSTAFLDLPAALPYREMKFVRHNLLTAVGPVVTFAVTVPAAYAGWGVWSLAAGALAGFVAASFVMFFAGSIRPRLTWDRSLVRRYFQFGWPIWLAQVLAVAAGWGSVIVVSATIGIAGLGFFQLAQTWASKALQLDGILSDTIFPALCSIQSSTARLRRAFFVTNRLSMLWAAPVGLGIALFATPVVHLLLGPAWSPAVIIVQAEGAGVVVGSIGYNWYLFFAARGDTRPQFVVGLLGAAFIVTVEIPLLILFGINGVAISIVVLALATYVVRQWYNNRVFDRMPLFLVVWREVLIASVAALAILVIRRTVWPVESIPALLAQGVAYVALCMLLAALVVGRFVLGIVRQVRAPRERGDVVLDAERATPAYITEWVMPRAMSFPLGVAHDASGLTDSVWVTTRDWPAVGRLDLATGEWSWTELPAFPHVPTPDGAGGCWAALTRSSAVAHVAADGAVRTIPLPKTHELLVADRVDGAIWAVDAHRRALVRVDEASGACTDVALPSELNRPDFVLATNDGRLWVADTRTSSLAIVDARTLAVERAEAPHPTRFIIRDDARNGVWLGASDRGQLSLVDMSARVLASVELPATPFGLAVTDDGQVLAALRDLEMVAVIDPDDASVVGTFTLPAGSGPMGLATAGRRCWVTCANSSVLVELDLDAAAVLGVTPAPMTVSS
jgi:O-antigen/teichoic acid export membrane protein/streptogramin lyase